MDCYKKFPLLKKKINFLKVKTQMFNKIMLIGFKKLENNQITLKKNLIKLPKK